MSMPIQRQSETFGYFDEGPRYARDRMSTDLPRGLAGVINSMGPRITGGLLNTREGGWHTPEYDPRVDGYADDYPEPWDRDSFDPSDGMEEDDDPDLESMDQHDPSRFIPGDHVHPREARLRGRLPFDRKAFAAAPPVPGASSYSLGHRVGTDWRDRTIKGTVIGLDGPQVAVRWDDGQHSNEEPHNIHLL